METTFITRPKAVVSCHVCSMKSSAQLVAALFTQLGFDVWVCYDVAGCGEYREEVERNIQNADVVVMLLNNHWAKSDQCQRELKFAQQMKFPQDNQGQKKPVLLSMAFSDLKWHPIFLLSTDLICHDTPSLLTGNTQRTLEQLSQTASVQLQTKRALIKGNRGNEYEVEAYADAQGVAKFRIKNLKTGTYVPEDQYEITVGPGANGVSRRLIKFKKTIYQQDDLIPKKEQTNTSNKCSNVCGGAEQEVITSLDKKTAEELYESVFGDEKPESICRLAQFYMEGNGPVEKDIKKALQLYEKAAVKGSVAGAVTAASIYEKGKKTPQDLDKAAELYSKAAHAGCSLAKKRLEKVMLKRWKRENECHSQPVIDEKFLLSMISVIRIM